MNERKMRDLSQSDKTFDPKAYRRGKFHNNPSLSVPDQSMTVREMYDRYVQRQEIPVNVLTPIFEEHGIETNGIDPTKLDLVEVQRLRMEKQAEVEQKLKMAKEESKKRKEDRQAKEQEELQFRKDVEEYKKAKETKQ